MDRRVPLPHKAPILLLCAALVGRFLFIGNDALSYDEATYLELARHPWHSGYYPDTLFLRHPPLAFLAIGAWSLVAETEWSLRLLPLLVTAAASALIIHTAGQHAGRRGAWLVAGVLALAFPIHAYALQLTMYPFAFLAVCVAMHARASGNVKREGLALTAFALVHLFGFLFLTLWLWEHRAQWQWGLRLSSPAWAWLAIATPLGLLLNRGPDLLALGPVSQFGRPVGSGSDLLGPGLATHVSFFVVALLLLNPPLLRAAWKQRRTWGPPLLAMTLLLGFFLASPTYLRYVLLLMPVVLVAALPALRRTKTHVVAAAALLALPAGAAYMEHGPDPMAEIDVPGQMDWRAAAQWWNSTDHDAAATPVPTALAHYMGQHGYHVTNRSLGPYVLELEGPGGTRTITRILEPTVPNAPLAFLPERWESMLDVQACATVEGLLIVDASCPPPA